LAWLLLLSPLAHAQQVHAWLERDRIGLGETTTLNVEVEGATVATPDYSPLLRDFRLSGNSSSRSYQSVNGRSQAHTLFAVALQPMREGVIDIPSLQVGAATTPRLALTVTAAADVPAHAGDDAFVEAEADTQAPWVQQAVGYVVRLYTAVPLVSGQLDQPPPEGASLQRVGDDVRYSRNTGGRRYSVVERHYLLVPEHSGTLAIPAAQFRGRAVAGFIDDFFGDGQVPLQASGPTRVLDVRAIPATAPQPWLPLHTLELRWTGTPQRARAGAAVTVTVEARADGATAAQLPALELPPVDGAQVFADPARVDQRDVDGRPQATVTRSFSIVPEAAGTLRIEGPRMGWWDVRAGSARTASPPALSLVVMAAHAQPAAPGSSAAGAQADRSGDDRHWLHVPGVQGPVRPWAFATVLFALAWLATFLWGLHRRPSGPATALQSPDTAATARTAAPAAVVHHSLRRALAEGDLAEIAAALCTTPGASAADLDALKPLLRDPRQRDAVEALQQARWGKGDAAHARAMLRAAFGDGVRIPGPDRGRVEPLPPLYP
jgi:hypothetical protein